MLSIIKKGEMKKEILTKVIVLEQGIIVPPTVH
jgi:hypothetical protein